MAYRNEDWIERTRRVTQALLEKRERAFGQGKVGVRSITGEEIVEMIREMREERINEILSNVLKQRLLGNE